MKVLIYTDDQGTEHLITKFEDGVDEETVLAWVKDNLTDNFPDPINIKEAWKMDGTTIYHETIASYTEFSLIDQIDGNENS